MIYNFDDSSKKKKAEEIFLFTTAEKKHGINFAANRYSFLLLSFSNDFFK